MKVILRSSSLPLALIGILTNIGVSRVDTGLRRGMAGRLRIGMTVEELEPELGLQAPGDSVLLGNGIEPDVTGQLLNGLLVRCRVNSRKCRTPAGIGGGSSEAQLVAAHEVVWEEPGVAFVKD